MLLRFLHAIGLTNLSNADVSQFETLRKSEASPTANLSLRVLELGGLQVATLLVTVVVGGVLWAAWNTMSQQKEEIQSLTSQVQTYQTAREETNTEVVKLKGEVGKAKAEVKDQTVQMQKRETLFNTLLAEQADNLKKARISIDGLTTQLSILEKKELRRLETLIFEERSERTKQIADLKKLIPLPDGYSAGRHYSIRMLNNRFDPQEIRIEVGDAVSWANDDKVDHSAKSEASADSENAFDTKRVRSKEASKVVVFKKQGNVPFYCEYHPTMKGIIVVRPRTK